MPILAIDPGREKCGLAVTDGAGAILFHLIVPRDEIVARVKSLMGSYSLTQILLGHATSSKALETELQAGMPSLKILSINETGSTLEARGVYWQENPPTGWRRLVPLSLQTPPVPIDDYAAVVLARRFVEQEGGGQE